MKKFRFTLEAVGTVRQRQEQKALELYAKALATLRQMAEQLEEAERDLSISLQEWRDKLAGEFSAADAARAHTCHRVLMQRRDDAALAVAAADVRVKAALQAMLQARQQRGVVDNLFDKQKALHQRDVARDEQKFLDEIAGRRNGSVLTWKPVETAL